MLLREVLARRAMVLWMQQRNAGAPHATWEPLSIAQRSAFAGALFAGAEITFWLGLALAGPRATQWLRRSFASVRFSRASARTHRRF